MLAALLIAFSSLRGGPWLLLRSATEPKCKDSVFNPNKSTKEQLKSIEIQDVPSDLFSELDYTDFISNYTDYVIDNPSMVASDSKDSNVSVSQDSGAPWDMYDIKPRCFSMCEPPELFFRETDFHVYLQLFPLEYTMGE